jgi:hypothetical protein
VASRVAGTISKVLYNIEPETLIGHAAAGMIGLVTGFVALIAARGSRVHGAQAKNRLRYVSVM